jgi:prephenate dehydratase
MLSIAHLGPQGTYSELAATLYAQWLGAQPLSNTDLLQPQPSQLKAYATIAQAIQATAQAETDISVVPIENSIGGSVTTTLDTLWEQENLHIQKALELPIHHALLSYASDLTALTTIYSHPQALAQCQRWLEKHLPTAQVIAANSTTEALKLLKDQPTIGAISSLWAAKLYQLPIVAHPINDYANNCTRFWILSRNPTQCGSHTSLSFSLPTNTPGALLKPLQLFASQSINMSRIESRPTQLSLGDYRFFIDIETGLDDPNTQASLQLLKNCTVDLKIFGSYDFIPVDQQAVLNLEIPPDSLANLNFAGSELL